MDGEARARQNPKDTQNPKDAQIPEDASEVTTPFGARLAEVLSRSGHLCVGVDPHSSLLSAWNLPDTAAGAREFGLRVVAASIGQVGIVKPQIAFFERFGSAGFLALEDVLAAARQADLMIIADVKRGDIGSSVDAYAHAWLGTGSALEADAMTVSGYQGVDSLSSAMALAHAQGKGLFVLAATSNPEASVVQRAIVQSGPAQGMSVARAIIEDVAIYNRQHSSCVFGSVGVVLGATADLASAGIDTARDAALSAIPVLAPGFGYQGALVSDVRSIYGLMTPGVIVTESRSILSAGPNGLADAISGRAREVAEAIE